MSDELSGMGTHVYCAAGNCIYWCRDVLSLVGMGCMVVLEALILVMGLPLLGVGVGEVFFVDLFPNMERACVVVGRRVKVTSGSTSRRRTNLWLRMIMM